MHGRPLRSGTRTCVVLGAAFALGLSSACNDSGPTRIELPVATIEVVNGCPIMGAGESCQIVVHTFSPEGQRLDNPILRWATTTPNVVTVSDRGLVTARVPGQGVVLVQNTTGSVQEQFDITVTPRQDERS